MTKKAAEVLKKLISHGVSRFLKLFRGNRSRSEIVATFLAVLELCRMKSVELEDREDEDVDIRFVRMPEETQNDMEGENLLGTE